MNKLYLFSALVVLSSLSSVTNAGLLDVFDPDTYHSDTVYVDERPVVNRDGGHGSVVERRYVTRHHHLIRPGTEREEVVVTRRY
jgi:hypothetical protein